MYDTLGTSVTFTLQKWATGYVYTDRKRRRKQSRLQRTQLKIKRLFTVKNKLDQILLRYVRIEKKIGFVVAQCEHCLTRNFFT